MQISKLFLPLGAVAVLSLWSPLYAQETDAQAKAREALRQKIAELNAQQQSPAAPAAPVAPIAPAAPAPPVVTTPQPPVVVVAPAAIPVVSTIPASPTVSAAPMDNATTARAREALRQKMLELDAQSAALKTTTASGATFTPATAAAVPGYQPIQVPPSSLTGTKEARLATLLQQYKTDQITPEQYHKQRAAIIAEP